MSPGTLKLITDFIGSIPARMLDYQMKNKDPKEEEGRNLGVKIPLPETIDALNQELKDLMLGKIKEIYEPLGWTDVNITKIGTGSAEQIVMWEKKPTPPSP